MDQGGDHHRDYPWAHLCDLLWRRFCCYVEHKEGPLETPCHIWIGAKSRGQGSDKKAWYTTFRVGRRSVRAHIFVMVKAGKMRPGMTCDHLCKNTLCVNENHLEVVTRVENTKRRWADARRVA